MISGPKEAPPPPPPPLSQCDVCARFLSEREASITPKALREGTEGIVQHVRKALILFLTVRCSESCYQHLSLYIEVHSLSGEAVSLPTTQSSVNSSVVIQPFTH